MGRDLNDDAREHGPEAVEAAFANAPRFEVDDSEPLTQDAVAEAFTREHAGALLFDHQAGAWYRWDAGRWRRDETRLAFHFARRVSRTAARLADSAKVKATLTSSAFASGVERFAQADPRFAVTSEVWDRDAFLLGTPKGTVDLRTGRLHTADPGKRLTKAAAVSPAGKATCKRWLAFLDDATGGDAELVRFLQVVAGYCLTGDTREHALFFVYGPGGNGKSVFLNTLAGILGDYAKTAAMDAFTASRAERHTTDLAMLRGARLVTCSETEEGRAWAEAKIKQLTGGDPITARFMRQDNFTFTPEFKLLIVGNHRPILRNVDDAARRRFNVIPFTRRPETPDRELEAKLRPEWPAILRWAIEGCLAWQREGLVRPEVVTKTTAGYFDEQDTFGAWLEECCETGARRWCATASLFASWSKYAKDSGEHPGTKKAFSGALAKRGFQPERKWVDGSAVRLFAGIALKRDLGTPWGGDVSA